MAEKVREDLLNFISEQLQEFCFLFSSVMFLSFSTRDNSGMYFVPKLRLFSRYDSVYDARSVKCRLASGACSCGEK